jgi:spore coat protein U-like protein
MKITHQLLVAAAAVLLLAVQSNAFAQSSDSGTFTVTADVVATCSITAGNTLGFGNYDPVAATEVTGTTTVAVTCSNGMSGTMVGLDYTGIMSDGGSGTLTYGLFSDDAHTTAWGDTDGVDRQGVTADGTQQTLTVYGKVDAGQTTAPTGSYSETVTATVYW